MVGYKNVCCLMHTLVLEDDLGTLSVIIILLFCLRLLNLIYLCSLLHRGKRLLFGDYFSIAYIAPWDLSAFKQGSHGMEVPGALSKMERHSLCSMFRRTMCHSIWILLVFKRIVYAPKTLIYLRNSCGQRNFSLEPARFKIIKSWTMILFVSVKK